jgi:succinate dehydrogenase / fumarate reductase cytochrome b subunit
VKKLQHFWASTIGKKIVMGVTGLIMVGFVILHMLGNLQVFIGPEKFNAYGAMLHGPLHEVTLALRAVLLVSVVLHIIAAIQLTRLDNAARPVAYARKDPQAATLASRTMRWGGVFLAVFIVLHLLHFTTGDIHPDFIPGDVYHNLITGMQTPWVAIGYIVAMIFLGLHLYHGAWGSVRSLGVAEPNPHPRHRPIAVVIAFVVWFGFTIIPLAVLFGWLRLG